jgi:hypothetical protein
MDRNPDEYLQRLSEAELCNAIYQLLGFENKTTNPKYKFDATTHLSASILMPFFNRISQLTHSRHQTDDSKHDLHSVSAYLGMLEMKVSKKLGDFLLSPSFDEDGIALAKDLTQALQLLQSFMQGEQLFHTTGQKLSSDEQNEIDQLEQQPPLTAIESIMKRFIQTEVLAKRPDRADDLNLSNRSTWNTLDKHTLYSLVSEVIDIAITASHDTKGESELPKLTKEMLRILQAKIDAAITELADSKDKAQEVAALKALAEVIAVFRLGYKLQMRSQF